VKLKNLRDNLHKLKNPSKAKILQGFFKTGVGQYGEGDTFLGISVPECRKIATKYANLSLKDITTLLKSETHEERLIALLILIQNFQKSSKKEKKDIYNFYLNSTKYINNWDLVDLSAPKIVGEYLLGQEIPKQVRDDTLIKLARSKNLWEKRIAIIATYQFIWKAKEYKETFRIAEILISDKHDLIQKAIGWMLREVGKKVSQEAEEDFLKKNYQKMGRTTLRYAIERFPEDLRIKYLKTD